MLSRDQVRELAKSVQPFAVEVRRHLHRHPELSFREEQTSAYVAGQLQALGYKFQTGVGGYGIKAMLEGGKPGRTVALRADMDALPVTEETGLPFASENPGVMHACGHDAHTATLLATAKALQSLQPELAGNVVFFFQPGEEADPGGASLMIKDGAMENPHVDAVFGVHVMPSGNTGTIEIGAGPLMAAPDEFDVTIIGKGGHGARPHATVDPVVVACQCITLLQQIVARNVSPFAQAVLTIGMIHGGTAPNVIPDTVDFRGTIRTMDPAVRELMPRRVEAVVRGVCEAAGADYRLVCRPGYPVLVNEPAMTELARRAAVSVLGSENVLPMEPSMGGEDFAFFLQKAPGSFARLGSTKPGTQNPYGLHTSRLMIDEACMAVGVAYFIGVVQEYLNGHN